MNGRGRFTSTGYSKGSDNRTDSKTRFDNNVFNKCYFCCEKSVIIWNGVNVCKRHDK